MLLSTVCTGFAFPARPSRSPRCRAPLPLLFSCILWVRCRVCSRGSFVLRPPPSSPSRRRRRSLRLRSPLPALLGCSLVSDVASLASFLSRPLSSLRSRRVAARMFLSFMPFVAVSSSFLGLCFATAEAAHRGISPTEWLGCSVVYDVASLAGFLSRPLPSLRSRCVTTPKFLISCHFLLSPRLFLDLVLPLFRPLLVYFPHWVALDSVIFWFLNSWHVRGKVSRCACMFRWVKILADWR